VQTVEASNTQVQILMTCLMQNKDYKRSSLIISSRE